MKDLSTDVIDLVKARAKANGQTQADLAKRLRVSLPTIKRWYQGEFSTLGNLKLLCDEVGLTLTEVFEAAEKPRTLNFQYTIEQESFFADHPEYLAYFDLLLSGHSPANIQKTYSLEPKLATRILSKLEKLRLIDWLPSDKIKLLVTGEPVWRKNGPLSKKLSPENLRTFLQTADHSKTHFFLHDYLPEDADVLKSKIEDLIRFARTADKRAKRRNNEAKPHGFYISLQNFRWNLDEFLKARS